MRSQVHESFKSCWYVILCIEGLGIQIFRIWFCASFSEPAVTSAVSAIGGALSPLGTSGLLVINISALGRSPNLRVVYYSA